MLFDQLKRREFITLIGGAAAAWPLAARAQQSAKIYRVAYLALVGDRDAIIVKQRLDELGYSEGRNLVFDFRSAQGHPERLPELAARGSEGGDLCCRKGLRSKNDLDVKEIVIFGPESSAAVKSMLGRCWNECANARDHLCLACRHAEPDWL
jgi:hypothetical protein